MSAQQPPTLTTENAGIDISPISPADRRNSLEKHLQTRPEEQDLKNRHILLDTNAAPSLQAKALELERQRATDNLKKGLGKRPERGELVDREFCFLSFISSFPHSSDLVFAIISPFIWVRVTRNAHTLFEVVSFFAKRSTIPTSARRSVNKHSQALSIVICQGVPLTETLATSQATSSPTALPHHPFKATRKTSRSICGPTAWRSNSRIGQNRMSSSRRAFCKPTRTLSQPPRVPAEEGQPSFFEVTHMSTRSLGALRGCVHLADAERGVWTLWRTEK